MRHSWSDNFVMRVVLSAAFAVFTITATFAQQAAPAPTRLAIEVTSYRGLPPSYLDVPARSGRGGAWYARFRRIGDFRPAPGRLPVRAVDLRPHLAEGKVQIVVSVHLGERFFEKQEPVATYLADEGERVVVRDLTRFGVEPFELKVVRLAPVYAAPPAIVNDTTSVEVVSMEPRAATLPTYDAVLRNQSEKPVVALALQTFAGDKLHSTWQPRGTNGRALIEPGSTHTEIVRLEEEARPAAGGYTPETLSDQRLRIRTVLFADHTFEGDPRPAVEIVARAHAHAAQRARLAALFEHAATKIGDAPANALARLRSAVAALGTDAESTLIAEITAEFPMLDKKIVAGWLGGVAVVLNGDRRAALDEVDAFMRVHAGTIDGETLRAWLRAAETKYRDSSPRY